MFSLSYVESAMTQIWFRDPIGFFNTKELHEFVPLPHMAFEEKLNAVMRFVLYFTVVLLVVQRSVKPVYLVVAVGAFTAMLYTAYDNEKKSNNPVYEEFNLARDRSRGDEACILPSKNNPFTNILVSDYALNPRRPEGCDINRSSVKKMAESFYEKNLYRDVDDIWGRRSSSRTFYQVPVQTIPNKQNEFAKWLFGKTGAYKSKFM
jgi:hypothetical protein